MKIKLFAISALFIGIFSACNENSVDTKGISDELQNRKIVRVTESEIFDLANKTGEEAVKKIIESSKRRSEALAKEKKTEEAVLACNYSSIHNLDSLANAIDVFKINRIDTNFKSKIILSEIEAQLLDAYKYNKENKLEMKPNLQAINDTLFVYMSPIMVSTQCIALSDQTKEKSTSEFQGIWSIYLKKRDIVLTIQKESKKK
ncbi:hypothetical protein MYP_4416 [Sporocytophaga myxococcoides]|uniref:Lipoprotein n=1 Tax=Sporocytophaga myxococcoides TaxID=153721 RepID=A0A098LJL1_9BACT|nr:hypothetical protein [Sporocytophaga myxococcoides]GAL87186.1 hypothetical protein MYP_4416 [Sporocytophaga myxococcoides]